MKKLNCWEFKNCGRQPGGFAEKKAGVCPAAVSDECDGMNSGQAAGRFCWSIAGTSCSYEVSGTTATKLTTGWEGPFLQLVMEEVGVNFRLS